MYVFYLAQCCLGICVEWFVGKQQELDVGPLVRPDVDCRQEVVPDACGTGDQSAGIDGDPQDAVPLVETVRSSFCTREGSTASATLFRWNITVVLRRHHNA